MKARLMAASLGLAWFIPPSPDLAFEAQAQSAPPVWISTPVTNATVGKPYEYFAFAEDPAGAPVSYTPLSLPTWLSLVPANSPRIYSVAGTLDRGAGSPATEVQLWSPSAGAYDAHGNLYIADRNNHRVWQVAASGVLTTFAGTGAPGFGGDGGAATRARLSDPAGVAVGPMGDIFISDRGNHRIRRVSPEGIILTVAGTGGAAFSGDGGPALQAAIQSPTGVAVDSTGRVVFADTGNHRLRAIDTSGIISTIAGKGSGGSLNDGAPALQASLLWPWAIALEAAGSVLYCEPDRCWVRRLQTNGTVKTVAGTGRFGSSGEGVPATTADLAYPQGLAVDGDGGILIADTFNNRIRRVDPAGIIRRIAGTGSPGGGGDGGPALSAQLRSPEGLVVRDQTYLIFDTSNDRVRRVSAAATIETIAGFARFGASGDGGPATQAILIHPRGGAYAPDGSFYVADTDSHRVRHIARDNTITTVAGTGVAGFSGDGGPAIAAALSSPVDVCVDAQGNLFVSDAANHRIRMITPDGVISTFAGTGAPGDSGDGGPALAAALRFPYGITLDADGNLYVTDWGNNRVRRIDTDRIIQEVAGTGEAGFAGDGGPALLAKFSGPEDIAFDRSGRLYVSDRSNHRVRVVSVDGIVDTVAGTGVPGFAGDGGAALQAQLNSPSGIAVSADGVLFIADSANHRVRTVSLGGVIQTYAGSGQPGPGGGGHSGDGGPPELATLVQPSDVEVQANGEVAIVEQGLGFVRKVVDSGAILRGTPTAGAAGNRAVSLQATARTQSSNQDFTILVETPPAVTLQPQPQEVQKGDTAIFFVTASGTKPLSYQWLHNGAALSDTAHVTGATSAQLSIADAGPEDAGDYQVVVLNNSGSTISEVAKLTVNVPVPPSITGQPGSVEVRPGLPVSFEVAATGTEPLSYLWFHENAALVEGGRFSGTRTPRLSITGVEVGDAGSYRVEVQNVAGSATSNPAILTVDTRVAPEITGQPESQLATETLNATFRVEATGTAPLQYAWSKDGTLLVESAHFVGVGTPELQIVEVLLADQGQYTVKVTNEVGEDTSEAATLTVQPGGPTITKQPESQTVKLGAAATFTVSANGLEPLRYQWRRDGNALTDDTRFSGTQTAELKLAAAEAGDAGEYRVEVQNAVGTVTSEPAVLTVDTRVAPEITRQPESQIATETLNATFHVEATGTAPLQYAWSKDGTLLVESEHFVGVGTPELQIVAVQLADQGKYTVKVTNEVGEDTSEEATLTVQPGGPTITKQPASQTVKLGAAATFSVSANGLEPLRYQWRRNGNDLTDDARFSGTQTAELKLAAAEGGDAGEYRVEVQNAVGTVTSDPAVLTVDTRVAPEITRQPESQLATETLNATFRVEATGTAPLQYAWSKDGTALVESEHIVGVATPELRLVAVQLADQGKYTVKVTNEVGEDTSEEATLTVEPGGPTITRQPETQSVNSGVEVKFMVGAQGVEPLQYQWFRNGDPLQDDSRFSGTRTMELKLKAALTSDSGQYTVRIQNNAGSATSDVARLTVTVSEPPVISQARLTAGGFSFLVSGSAGEKCQIDYSTDFVSWQQLKEIILQPTGVEVTDPVTEVRRFYRARLTVTVSESPVISQARLTTGGFSFVVTGSAGEKCRIDYSMDFVSWQQLKEIVLEAAGVEVTDPATETRRFYRAVVP